MEDKKTLPVVAADPQQGLTGEQVAARVEAGLVSGAAVPAGKTRKEILRSHCFTFFNLIFALLALMLVIGRSTVMNMGFLMVAAINTVIGIVQELRAKKAVDALTLVAERPVAVIRSGKLLSVSHEAIVRDDIARFAQGDQLCADGILRSGELWVDESLISGEEDAVAKKAGDPVWSGSVVLSGRGSVQLTAVGKHAFAARLAAEAKQNPRAKKTEMMRSLDKLIKVIGCLLIPVGLALFYQEFTLLELGLQESVEGTVAALVGMIPEGLYLLTSLALAASALKLSRKRVLVRDMSCIESLARVDVLCVDKTGTITQADMEVEDLIPLSGHSPEELQQILTALYGSGEPDNATAKAMQELFSGESPWRCKQRIPFSPERRWSGAVFESAGAFVVGAPEAILSDRFAELQADVDSWTEQGYRVLLAASYHATLRAEPLKSDRAEPLALILLSSRIREGAAETFRFFEQQGVSLRVISGDNPHTASHTAMRAGIPGAERRIDVSRLSSDSEFDEAVRSHVVFGRVGPGQKRQLIAALQRQGHTVAMTGDGVNDLLAMKQADCSVALCSGAQAASRMADLVLLENDFSTMPGIVGEGRRVINNIQRSASLFLVKNIFSCLLALISLFSGLAYPFQPIHLTVVGALTIGIPSFFLAMEPNYERIRGRFLQSVLLRALPGGITNVLAILSCLLLAPRLGVSGDSVSTICAGILAVVGLLVLFQVCTPFGTFRKFLWGCMAVGLAGCFTLLGPVFSLYPPEPGSGLLMLVLMLMCPTVYCLLQHLLHRKTA